MAEVHTLIISKIGYETVIKTFSDTELLVRYLNENVSTKDMTYIEENWRDLRDEKQLDTGNYRVLYKRLKAEYNIGTNMVEVRAVIGRRVYDEPVLNVQRIDKLAEEIINHTYQNSFV